MSRQQPEQKKKRNDTDKRLGSASCERMEVLRDHPGATPTRAPGTVSCTRVHVHVNSPTDVLEGRLGGAPERRASTPPLYVHNCRIFILQCMVISSSPISVCRPLMTLSSINAVFGDSGVAEVHACNCSMVQAISRTVAMT